MSSASKLTAQLRVRLSRADMDFLVQLAQKKHGKVNISQAVKELIEQAREHPQTVPIDSCTHKKLEDMALLLRRTPKLVVADAIDAVNSLSEDDAAPPLLVMELKLIKTYRNRANKVSKDRK